MEVAGNGRDAVEMVEEFPFDAVFMDCEMPVLDGFGATAKFACGKPGPGTSTSSP